MLEHSVVGGFYTRVSVSTLIKDPVCQNQIPYSHKKPLKFSDVVMKSADTCFPSGRRGRSGKGVRVLLGVRESLLLIFLQLKTDLFVYTATAT